MNDYNSWFSLILGVIFGLVVVGFVSFVILREALLNRAIMRTQVTTARERELAELAIEQQRMVRGEATRIQPLPEAELEPQPLVIDLDALEA